MSATNDGQQRTMTRALRFRARQRLAALVPRGARNALRSHTLRREVWCAAAGARHPTEVGGRHPFGPARCRLHDGEPTTACVPELGAVLPTIDDLAAAPLLVRAYQIADSAQVSATTRCRLIR